jgi:hypothetical protein
VAWRLQFFKLLYFVTSVVYWRESWASFKWRRKQVDMTFSGGTTRQDAA